MASWSDESLLRRPPAQDRKCPRARNAKAQAARTFGVGISTLKRYATKKARRGESLQPGKAPGKPPKMSQPASKLLAERGPKGGAPVRHPKGALRVRGGRKRGFGEPLEDVPRHSQDRP